MRGTIHLISLTIFLLGSQISLDAQEVLQGNYLISRVATNNVDQEDEDLKLKVNAKTNLVSRFIWRGLELANQPHIQPEVTLSLGNFFIGAWASQALSPLAFNKTKEEYKAVLPYMGYGFDLWTSSNLSVLVLDHYHPNLGKIGDGDRAYEGGNTIELRAIFKSGSFDLLGSINLYNDAKKSTYVEIGYTAKVPGNYAVRPLVSFTPTESPFNGSDDFAFTQIGVITSKQIKITEAFSVPLRVEFIVNPELNKFYTAFGMNINFQGI